MRLAPAHGTTMNATRRACALMLATMVMAGCAGPDVPLPVTPSADAGNAAVVRRRLVAPAVPAPPPASARSPVTGPPPEPIAIPATALYVCVSESGGQRKQTAIEFAPNVLALCKRHPEMGPCQYERDLCRRSGGRVFAANGQEITRQIEDEYDRKVMRARFRAN